MSGAPTARKFRPRIAKTISTVARVTHGRLLSISSHSASRAGTLPVTPTSASSGSPASAAAQLRARLVSSPIDVSPSKNRNVIALSRVLAGSREEPERVEEGERERDPVVLPLAGLERPLGDAGLRLRAQPVRIALDDRRLRDDGDVEELGGALSGLHRLGVLGDEVGEPRALGVLEARQIERRRNGAHDPPGHDEPAQAYDKLREGPRPHERSTKRPPVWIRWDRRADLLGAVATYRYVVADVFTDRPLAGNQLAVFTDAREIPEEQLQPLAREIDFSETVFVYPPEGEGHARVRIFTPALELAVRGPPGARHGVRARGAAPARGDPSRDGRRRRPRRARAGGPGRIVFGRMSQPIPTVEAFDREAELLAAVGIERSELPVELYDLGIGTSTSACRARTRSPRSSRT